MKIEVNHMEVEIRLMKDEELSQVANLVQKVFQYNVSSVAMDSNDFSIVAVINHTIVGQILVHPIKDPFLNRVQYYLQDICVDAEYREKGIASKLIQYVFGLAEKKHVFRIFLTSSNSRIEAHLLYKKMGFYKRESNVFAKDFN